MSLIQMQDKLDNDRQSLQQKAGMGDMFAMIKLYEMVKDDQQKQMAQGLDAQQQPPVKDQLIQAAMGQVAPAAPAPPSGIAMAAGGIVRHFDGSDGSVPDTGYVMRDANGDPYTHLWHAEGSDPEGYTPVGYGEGLGKAFGAIGDMGMKALRYITSAPDPSAKPSSTAASTPTGIGAAADDTASGMLPHAPAKPPIAAAQQPKATPDPTPAGLAAAAQAKTPTPSVPPNATKVDAASEDQPADTPYMDAASEYLNAKKPLDGAAIQIYKDKLQAGQTAHDAYLAAKQANPWEKVIAILHPYVEANGNKTGLGNMGTLAEGSYNLMRNQQAEKLANAKSEEEYQARQLGIQAGLTDAQLHQLMGNFTTTNSARAADDKTELNNAKQQTALERTANQALVQASQINKNNATAAKTRSGASGAWTPVTAARARAAIDAQVDRMKDALGQPLESTAAENIRQQRYAAVGLPGVELGASTPAAAPPDSAFKVRR